MISYYKYWQALNKLEESIKTVNALQTDVPPMVMAQYEMDELAMKYWKEEAENFTKYSMIFFIATAVLGYAYTLGVFHVK